MTVTSSPMSLCSLEASWHFTHTQVGETFLESEALRVTTLELSALGKTGGVDLEEQIENTYHI